MDQLKYCAISKSYRVSMASSGAFPVRVDEILPGLGPSEIGINLNQIALISLDHARLVVDAIQVEDTVPFGKGCGIVNGCDAFPNRIRPIRRNMDVGCVWARGSVKLSHRKVDDITTIFLPQDRWHGAVRWDLGV
jgi:hypothetical protein